MIFVQHYFILSKTGFQIVTSRSWQTVSVSVCVLFLAGQAYGSSRKMKQTNKPTSHFAQCFNHLLSLNSLFFPKPLILFDGLKMLWFPAITRSYIINMRIECLRLKSKSLCRIWYLEICCVCLWLGWGCLWDVLLMPLPLLLFEFLIAREKAIFCLSKLNIIYHKYLKAPKINRYSFFLEFLAYISIILLCWWNRFIDAFHNWTTNNLDFVINFLWISVFPRSLCFWVVSEVDLLPTFHNTNFFCIQRG